MKKGELNSLFDDISFSLHVELDESDDDSDKCLMNRVAKSEAGIIGIEMDDPGLFDEAGMFVELDDKQLGEVGFNDGTMTMCSNINMGVVREFKNNRGFFTVGEVLDCVMEVEEEARPGSKWMGGIDVNHVVFEGLRKDGDVLVIEWGS